MNRNYFLAAEGVKPSLGIAVALVLFLFFGFYFLALFASFFLAFCVFIFRNLERIPQNREKNVILAPCDGILESVINDGNKIILKFKINILNCGILRNPIFVDSINIEQKHGFFIKSNSSLKDILNTKAKIEGFLNDKLVYKITLSPELVNVFGIYHTKSPFLGDRIGFMKCGYLLLEINSEASIFVEKGDSILGGESILGRFNED